MSRRRRKRSGRVKASGPGGLVLPGGASFPPGSSVTDPSGMLASLQQRTNPNMSQQPQSVFPPMVPLDRSSQFWAPFGPGAPMYPAPLNAPRRDTGQADPRTWEYPVTWNLTQDVGRLTDWSTLRGAARKVDLISQCLRVRRVEQSSLSWDITLTERVIEQQGVKSAQDKRALLGKYDTKIAGLIEFWQEPDTTNGYNWTEWLEMLLEEQMVIDAVSVYPRFTYGGELASLELIDGATIKPLLDERGNRPHAPAPAYQQWLYGFPRGEYIDSGAGGTADWEGTAGSLIYKPRYRRVESPYGYSAVEQALTSAELWLRRQQWMVAEYTEGTTPRTFLKATGISMTPEQLRAWEDSLNDFYGGSTPNRHRMRLFPDGFDPVMADDTAERYKPDYDEFLVKLVCAHMDVQPQEIGFTPRNGLGGAGHGETQEGVTYRKTLRPTCEWLVALMNQISYAYLDMPRDLTFQFLGLDSEDEDGADQVTDRRFRSGRVTLNETRDESGLSRYDFPEADMPMIVGQRGVVFLDGASELAPAGEEISPPQAPTLSAGSKDPVPGGQGVGGKPDEDADPGDDTALEPAAKAELGAYRRWAGSRRWGGPGRTRPFEFEVLTKGDLERSGYAVVPVPDGVGVQGPAGVVRRVVFKADAPGGGVDPKVLGPAGWERDQEVADQWAPPLLAAVLGAVDVAALAQQWASNQTGKVAAPAARVWLTSQNITLGGPIAGVLTDLYTEGYWLGHVQATSQVTGQAPEWGGWSPGRPATARVLIPDRLRLQQLWLGVGGMVDAIADHRLDAIAAALAGLAEDTDEDTVSDTVTSVLDDRAWADRATLTEVVRAAAYAAMGVYAAGMVTEQTWVTAAGDVCPVCLRNADAGPVRVGQNFPSGHSQPPAHPWCRCGLAPQKED
jgi:hypothetical protein